MGRTAPIQGQEGKQRGGLQFLETALCALGALGALGRHKVNIASMSLSRDTVGGYALTVLNLDSVPSQALMDEIEHDPDISNVKVVKL